jgi:hypothetical protein
VTLAVMNKHVLGQYATTWPLIKLLDIGGAPVNVFGDPECPPIPCHVHSGTCVRGKLCGGGKLEAYHFPPVNIPMERVICRLGFKPGTSNADVIAALRKWGRSDDMYKLCNVFEVQAGDGWTIR